MSWRDAQDFARETDPVLRGLRGMVRRALVGVTSVGGVASAVWQVLGAKVAGKREARTAEVWQGIGFSSRPRPTSSAEAIVIGVGAAGNAAGGAPAIVASRDEALRQAVVPDLGEDEVAIYNSSAVIIGRSNGTFEIRSVGGAAVALVKLSELQALRNWAAAHFHTDPVSGFTGTPTVAPPVATGTTVVKGE